MRQNEPQVGEEYGRSDDCELRLGNNRRGIIAAAVEVFSLLPKQDPSLGILLFLPLQPPLAAPAGHRFRSTTSPH